MSVEDSAVTPRHFAYLGDRTRPEDPFLAALRADAEKEGIPAISIGPAQASFLQILLRAIGARTVIEVGTLAGYSAIAMARALPPDGILHTIEISPKHAAFAEERIRRSEVAGRIVVHLGDAKRILATLPDGAADAIFLDADKAGYPEYLEHGLRLLRPRGLVLVDNAFAFGELFAETPKDRETPAVRRFNEIMAAETRLQSVIVPLGDGCWVGVKL